jgi:hypothetical protein
MYIVIKIGLMHSTLIDVDTDIDTGIGMNTDTDIDICRHHSTVVDKQTRQNLFIRNLNFLSKTKFRFRFSTLKYHFFIIFPQEMGICQILRGIWGWDYVINCHQASYIASHIIAYHFQTVFLMSKRWEIRKE